MKNLLTKTLASVAAAAMVFGLGTVNVVNADDTDISTDTAQNIITTAGTYKLDVDLANSITVSNSTGEVTLDLNGHNVNVNSGNAIINKGKLTIKGTGNVTGQKAAIGNTPTGTVTIDGGSYSSKTWYAIKNLGTMTINQGASVNNNGSNEDNKAFSSLIDNGWYGNEANDSLDLCYKESDFSNNVATLTINDGTFNGGKNTVKNDDNGVLIINGGTFENDANAQGNDVGTIFNWNNATINGGTYKGKYIANGSYGANSADKGQLTINNGNFDLDQGFQTGGGGTNNADGKLSVKGGTFTKAVSFPNTYKNEIEGGTFVNDPTTAGGTLAANAPTATVTNGNNTTFAIGQNSIAEAANTEGNTVTLTKGSVALNNPKATVKNGDDNKDGTLTVNGTTVPAGQEYTKPSNPETPVNPSVPGKDDGTTTPKPSTTPTPTPTATPKTETKPASTKAETKPAAKSAETKTSTKKADVPAKRAVTDTSVQ